MLIDISPLRHNRDFRYVYAGQFISFFGTMLSYVAIPFQMYQLTSSTMMVGFLGIVELIPLLFTAFIGGALADVIDKKKMLMSCELALSVCCLALMLNSLQAHPHVGLIFVIAGIMSAFNGLHRPSLDALLPRTVKHEEIQATSVLISLKGSIGLIGGPAVAGFLISAVGVAWTYAVDLGTFLFSCLALSQIKSYKVADQQEKMNLRSIKTALLYARSRAELMGTYIVDFLAMVLAMPNALYPALAKLHGGPQVLGWFYAAPAFGALIITIFSGWTKKIHRHGAAVAIAASLWGLSIAAMGLCHHMVLILFFLILAGAADSVSAIFRVTIWNETIPDNIRGRMAGLEMVSYMSGPLLGNAQAGLLASALGLHTAITVGGSLSTVCIVICTMLLPKFWTYRKHT